MLNKHFFISGLLAISMFLPACQSVIKNQHLNQAECLMAYIMDYYRANDDYLMNETFPKQVNQMATYLASEDTLQGERVAYLWPASGVLSAYIALYQTSQSPFYLHQLEDKIIPALNRYYNIDRPYPCYQSYLKEHEADAFYDDNIWIAIDYCELYHSTNNKAYLNQAIQLWEFIYSGWDEQVGGGIYWCEQKRKTKNTCSNAPAAVLACKLYELTKEHDYLLKAQEIYKWTKDHLQDETDGLYFDNINLNNKVDTRKYSYNSGQMLQASVLLYLNTDSINYLKEAQRIAASAYKHFTTTHRDGEQSIQIFNGANNWFISILFRGYYALYQADGNTNYINAIKDNLNWLDRQRIDANGLYEQNWIDTTQTNAHKWLLDQTCMVEIKARISNY
ncbi:MAG: glycoside hydrolase family 76 protein [Carboxylicivirga sp.]|nr:glycoside hydrolase family 76 protein [Carboxylicivirga sp.]